MTQNTRLVVAVGGRFEMKNAVMLAETPFSSTPQAVHVIFVDAATKADIPQALDKYHTACVETLRGKEILDVTHVAQTLDGLKELARSAHDHVDEEAPENLMELVKIAAQTIVGNNAEQPVFTTADCIYTGQKSTP